MQTKTVALERRINGTMVQVTAVFGFTLSGLVVQDIVNGNSHKTLS